MATSLSLRARLVRLCLCLALLPLDPTLLFSHGEEQVCAMHGAQCACLDHCLREGANHHEEESRPSCHRAAAPRHGEHAAESAEPVLPEGPVWAKCGRRTQHAVAAHEMPGVMAATAPLTTLTTESLVPVPRHLPLPATDGPAPPPPRV